MQEIGPEPMKPRNRDIAYLPSSAVIGLLVSIWSWMLTALLWIGDWVTLGQWPNELKMIIAHVVSIAASIYVVTKGRADYRSNRPLPGQSIGITGVQAIWVALAAVIVGVFGTWLVWGPPH